MSEGRVVMRATTIGDKASPQIAIELHLGGIATTAAMLQRSSGGRYQDPVYKPFCVGRALLLENRRQRGYFVRSGYIGGDLLLGHQNALITPSRPQLGESIKPFRVVHPPGSADGKSLAGPSTITPARHKPAPFHRVRNPTGFTAASANGSSQIASGVPFARLHPDNHALYRRRLPLRHALRFSARNRTLGCCSLGRRDGSPAPARLRGLNRRRIESQDSV
jgi:hypothetical protein